MRISSKITILAFTGVLAVGLSALALSNRGLHHAGDEQVKIVRNLLMESKRDKLRDMVNSVMALVQERYDNAVVKKSYTEEDAKREALKAISAMRFGAEGKDYFWVNDTTPKMIMHPVKPELNGKPVGEMADPNGKKLFIAMVDVCREKGFGYVDYMWPKPGEEKPVAKLSYVAEFKPWGWIIGTGVYTDDVGRTALIVNDTIGSVIYDQTLQQSGLIAVAVIVFSFGAAFMARSIAIPIHNVSDRLKDIAEGEGDLTARLEVHGTDEIGRLSKWFNKFMEKLHPVISEVKQNSAELAGASNDFHDLAVDLANTAVDLTSRSSSASSESQNMAQNLAMVAMAIDQASTNINAVAAAAEEMSTTIYEIARHSEKARMISEAAVSEAANASGSIQTLGDKAKEIGKVTETINAISEQTKLLALNATIEAARAGDAGKGFAVVANEIKDLARQTSDSTGDIKSRIEAIQTSIADAIEVIGRISGVVTDVNMLVSSIAASVEEQAITTREIAANVGQASSGINDVNSNITQTSSAAIEITIQINAVDTTSGELRAKSESMQRSAAEVRKLCDDFNRLVSSFKV